MNITHTKMLGCFVITPFIHCDERGRFVKSFVKSEYITNNLTVNFVEEFYSKSVKGVLRGLHFQLPPKDHTKLVYCVEGSILDVVVDIRKNSPTFGMYEIHELNDENCKMLYVPSGFAHGFYVKSTSAIVMYKVTSGHSQKHDSGIRWDSVGIPWPISEPTISERDRKLVPFSEFKTPFYMRETE